jgi:hypothetical protein
MSIRYQSWKWRHRSPRCDHCQGKDMRRLRIEVDWKAQATKMTWKCSSCGNCVYVFSHKKQQQQAA